MVNMNLVDVWEVIDQTLNGATITTDHEDLLLSNTRSNTLSSGTTSNTNNVVMYGLQLLVGDGDFWRRGGVMEARIREWLDRRYTSSSDPLCGCTGKVLVVEDLNDDDAPSGTGDDENTIIKSPCTIRTCNGESLEQSICQYSVHTTNNYAMEPTRALIQEEEEEEEEEDDDDDEEQGHLCPATIMTSVPGNGHDITETVGTPNPKATHDELICPVCLERLSDHDNIVESYVPPPYHGMVPCRSDALVQSLACGHAFHRDCLTPWQHMHPNSTACCPCCRAPISTSTAPDLLLISLPYLELHYASSHDNAHNIMSLLADVETTLDRLGLRS